MEINRNKCIKIILSINLLLLSHVLFPQYLRDSTAFVGLDAFYPTGDSLIFNNYQEHEKYQLFFGNIFSIPEVMVQFDGQEYPLLFDFGNNDNITITTAIADSIKYQIRDTTYTYTPEGKIRGQVFSILLPAFQTLNQHFTNETGILSDWSIFSTSPINGLVGLKYVGNKCFTLSYSLQTLAIGNHSIVPELKNPEPDLIQLEHYTMHPYGVHFKGRVYGTEAIVYFDTGKSHSAINQDLVPADRIVTDKSGAFFNGAVDIEIGQRSFTIYYPRVKNTNRNIESNLPVGIEVGSDILKYFLLTIDRTNNQNLLIIH